MRLNSPMIDFVTATTNSFRAYRDAAHEIVPAAESGKRGQFLQYKGDRYNNIFHGQAEQRGRTHYLIQISGADADEHTMTLCESGMRFTRVDVQITCHRPNWYSARELADSLTHGAWPRQRRKIVLIENGGDDTVYIGSRKSDKYIRIYVKDADYIRFEVELKGERARAAAAQYRDAGENALGGILAHEVRILPQTAIGDVFERACEQYKSLAVSVPYVEASKIRQMQWLASILPAIEKMANDHDYGNRVRGWLTSILQERN